MDIHHLKVFASVYKHRSFSVAAEELNLAQPTVSDHIKALEVELNCKLSDCNSARRRCLQSLAIFPVLTILVLSGGSFHSIPSS